MDTDPRGQRIIPPSIRTALGTCDPAARSVVIDLSDPAEEAEVVRLFQEHAWNVVRARGDVVRVLGSFQPILCVTDARDDFLAAKLLVDETCVLVCVTEDTEAAQVEAYFDGADWVEPRPLVVDEISTLHAFARVE